MLRKATGLHYGIISCEGCKGFFKRAITNKRIYRCVNGDESCQMSRKDRNRCQFCRLKKCLHVGMNRKAIREDGMPGGRNKYTGPVNYSPEEVGGILNGSFYSQLALPSSSTPSSSPLSSGSMPKCPNEKKGLLQTQIKNGSPRSQKRRRSLASDQLGVPQAKMMAPNERNLVKTEAPNFDRSQSVVMAQSVVDRLHNADTKDIIDLQKAWPSFKNKETLSINELYEAFPKIAEQSFTAETAWLRQAGLIDTIGIVDFFTLLSHSWQPLALIRLMRYGEQLEHFNTVISKYETPTEDSTRIVEIFPTVLQIAQLYTRVNQLQITDREFSIIKVLCVMNTDVSGLESQKVTEVKNLYLMVSQSVFGGSRTFELLRCLQDIRNIYDQMKDLDLNMLIFLIRVATTTCREILIKNKEDNEPGTSASPLFSKSYDSTSLHSNNSSTKADENESGCLAPTSPVIFSPETKILNASLSINLERQLKSSRSGETQNNNDSVMMSTNSTSSSPTPPSSDENTDTGLPSYVPNKKTVELKPQSPQLNNIYQNSNFMAKFVQDRLLQSYIPQHQVAPPPSAQHLLYQQLRSNPYHLNQFHPAIDNDDEEEIDVDA